VSFTTTITCPHCGRESRESVPVEACVIVYDCPGCDRLLRPKKGDCCVFCSYGADPCPTAPERR
jgi:hypothetical protein